MKTIIISDIHNRINWIEESLNSPILQPYDNIVFLGDYFDDFNDSPKDVANVAEWLKQSIKKPNRIHLMGTHDLWYRFPYRKFSANGNTDEKAYVIRSVMKKEDWDKLYLYHYEQDFLMTHAGIHINLMTDYVTNHQDAFDKYIVDNQFLTVEDVINNIIKPACEEALEGAKIGCSHPWLEAGIIRGGNRSIGGIIWLDWIYEFEPISGLNQIVGHTELDVPGKKCTRSSSNYNLDTRNNHIGIIENGVFTFVETKDIWNPS